MPVSVEAGTSDQCPGVSGHSGGEGDGITECGSQSIKYNCEVLFSFSFLCKLK